MPVFEYLFRQYEPEPQDVLELLESYQLTFEFRQEQHYRDAWASYCDRYDQMAQQNQQDLAAMRDEPDLFAWFWKKRTC
jgi:predicted component of type VI protein secretion system